MDTWIGDWLEDSKKLEFLTEERAVADVWAMNDSPDYDANDVNKAIKKAARHLGITKEEFIVLTMVEYPNAHKVS